MSDKSFSIYASLFFILPNILFFIEPSWNSDYIIIIYVDIIIILFLLYSILSNSIKQRIRKNRKCIHLVKGASHNPLLCRQCTILNTERTNVLKKLDELESYKKDILNKKKSLDNENEKRILLKLNSEIENLRKMDPFQFEIEVGNLFELQGYDVLVTSKTNDEGKDIILKKNNETTYVECKRYSKNTKVSRPTLQKLYGVMMADGVKNGIIVTTSSFTKECIEFSKKIDVNIKFIGEQELTKLFRDNSQKGNSNFRYKQYCSHNLSNDIIYKNNLSILELEEEVKNFKIPCGELVEFTLDIQNSKCKNNHQNINKGIEVYDNLKSLNSSYNLNLCPKCNSKLIKKKQRKSSRKFWGCSRYPECNFTKSIKR